MKEKIIEAVAESVVHAEVAVEAESVVHAEVAVEAESVVHSEAAVEAEVHQNQSANFVQQLVMKHVFVQCYQGDCIALQL